MWNSDPRRWNLRGGIIYTKNYFFSFPVYKFSLRVKHANCGNIRVQFLLVTSTNRLNQNEELGFLVQVHLDVSSGHAYNLDFVYMYVFYSILVIFFPKLNPLLWFI